MTSESVRDTEPWVADKGAKYAYGYEKSGRLISALGGTGYPYSVLFDATGKAVWAGHPASLSESDVEKALPGALPKLPWEWEPALQPAAKLLTKRQYAAAIADAQKAGAAGEPMVTAIQSIVKGRVAALKASKQAGDFLAVSEGGAGLLKDLKDLPEAAEVDGLVKEVASDKEAQKVIAGQKQVRDILAEKVKKRDLPNVLKKLEKIKTDLPGTAAARDAGEAIDTLRKPD